MKLKKKETNLIFMDTNNNLFIKGHKTEISLNIRNASYVKDEKNLLLTIIANITIQIDYSEEKSNSNYRYNDNALRFLNNDTNQLRELIHRSRQNKMNY